MGPKSEQLNDDHLQGSRFNGGAYIYLPHNRLMVSLRSQIYADTDFISALS